MPTNALTSEDYKVKKILNTLFPEGWSFFTRSPQEEIADLYKIEKSQLHKLTIANGEPRNLFGMSRMSRRIGMELSIIAAGIPDSSWIEADQLNINLVIKEAYNLKCNNVSVKNLSNDEYLIAVYKKAPWTYARHPENFKMKYKLAKVKLEKQ